MDAHNKAFPYTTVATAPSPAASGTSLIVATGEGVRFPPTPFNATVWPLNAMPTPANAEIVRVTGRVSDTLTIVRTQEGTSARTILVGDQIAATITPKELDEPTVKDAPLSDVFVPAGYTFSVGRVLKMDGVVTVDGEVISL